MSARRLTLIRLALVLSCLTALFGTYLPGFFSPVAGAKASRLTTLSSLTQSEGPTLEELQQQMEAIKQQLEANGATDELMQQYQKLLDQINSYDEQGTSGQSNIELQKKTDAPNEDSGSSTSVTGLKKKNRPGDKGD